MPLQTYRYAVCGGANTVLGFFIYFMGFEYIFNREIFHFGLSAFKPHNAALFLSSSIIFCTGFLMNKFMVFTGSNLRGRIQLFRYFLSFAFNLMLNYLLLKLLVEIFQWNAITSQLLTVFVIISVSYLTQKHFTFRISTVPVKETEP